jgi:cytochrome P450
MRTKRASLRELRQNPLAYLTKQATEQGDVARFRIGPFKVYLLNRPDLIRDLLTKNHHAFEKGRGLQQAKRLLGEGLLTSEGREHRNQRLVIQPLFHRRRLATYTGIIVDHTEAMADSWAGKKAVDVHQEMGRLALSIVAKTLFGTDIGDGESQEIGRALTTAVDLFNRSLSPWAELVEQLPLPSSRRFRVARRVLDNSIDKIIADRRRGALDGDDLLTMLLAARDESGSPMTDHQVRDEAMTIFLAGHETTANALTWTLYLLAGNAPARRKLHDELDAVLGDRTPTMEDVLALDYTRMVFAEAMRLYPPAWAIGRRATKDIEIEGYRMKRGSIVVASQWVTHHDPRFWPESYSFRPERFAASEVARLPKGAYFPFGSGPRICIGEHFAWMEGILILACLAKRYELHVAPGQIVATQPSITLRPKYGLRMRVQKRERLPLAV